MAQIPISAHLAQPQFPCFGQIEASSLVVILDSAFQSYLAWEVQSMV
jgi:hypothetical protein